MEEADMAGAPLEKLATVLSVVHPKHRDLFELLASTGLRISEALALEWRHLELEEAPKVKVRQQFYRCRYQPPKTKKGRREVPIPARLAAKLRRRKESSEWGRDEDLAFPGESGMPPPCREPAPPASTDAAR
ncbi:MAG TPA: hypothetical protein VHI96_01190 [Solirubrobacterales bacterium]|jgi:integrase|nr:hypothetical protein [Solirubrobacterales bacterium]